jgi:hypothetical protein
MSLLQEQAYMVVENGVTLIKSLKITLVPDAKAGA